MPNTTSVAATIGASTAGPTCSMPTRSRCWFCHPGHSASPATTTTAATTPSASHPERRARGDGVRPNRPSSAATPYPASVPSRYPMAADSPLTAAWAGQARGSMLGSSDHHQKSSATATPPNVGRRDSQRRRRAGSWLTSHPRLPVVVSPILALVPGYRPTSRCDDSVALHRGTATANAATRPTTPARPAGATATSAAETPRGPRLPWPGQPPMPGARP
jgi:hypothetical protein